MFHRHMLTLGLTLAVLLLSACSPTQIPRNLPGISPPAVPPLAVPSLSVPVIPSLTVPTLALPTVNAPAIGLTLVNGAISTPAAPASTSAPAVPVTGGSAPEVAKWFLYGVVALIGVAIIIMVFARFMRRSDNPNKTDWPERK